MGTLEEEKSAVGRAAWDFLTAYAKGDVEALLGMMSNTEEALTFGINEADHRKGLEGHRRGFAEDFSQHDRIKYELLWSNIWVRDDVAWVAGEFFLTAKVGGKKHETNARGTAVLVKEGGVWKAVHAHFSKGAASLWTVTGMEPQGERP